MLVGRADTAFPHKQTFSRVWTKYCSEPSVEPASENRRVGDRSVSWRRFPRILTHPQPRPNGPTHCTLHTARCLGAGWCSQKLGTGAPQKDWGRRGESLSEECPTKPGAVWRGINESNTTFCQKDR